MRKFIVSDLHGNGEVYDSIIAYLENMSSKEEVELYINGDLIDRGPDSYRMFEDVTYRMAQNDNSNFKVHYLGGNHELMMYNALRKRRPEKSVFPFCTWFMNGGHATDDVIDERDDSEVKYKEFLDKVSNLKIYKKFEEKIGDKPILLVHARAPSIVPDECTMKISDGTAQVYKSVWMRNVDEFRIPHRIGHKDYFTIIGHTPVYNIGGFMYYPHENYLNIDGGCAAYAYGYFDCDHVPLVEVEDGKLSILVWNHNNEIMRGYYMDGNITEMSEEDLNSRREYINHELDGNGKDVKKYTKEK